MYQQIFPKTYQSEAVLPEIKYFANTSIRTYYPPRLLHRHFDRCELLLVTQGSGNILVGTILYPVKQGDLIIINSGEMHEEHSSPTDRLCTYCCGISGNFNPRYRRNHLLPGGTVPVISTGDSFPILKALFDEMYQEILRKGNKAHFFCASLAGAVLTITGKLLEADLPSYSIDGEYLMIDRIRTYFDDHYEEITDLEEIGASMNVSISYLSHTFKKFIGYSPKQYIIRRRLGEAQSLLVLSEDPVTDISLSVGYDNTNYFSTLFKRFVNMPPSRYRDFCTQRGLSDISAI